MSAPTLQKYKVAIKCLVYNHEPYLRECLEGFVMQQTDFPFVAIVHDDASTDHSVDIIREYAAKYPDIIHPLYETENQWRKADGSLRKIMNDAIEATGAPYIAMCEGDDYWTDPHKLQKQVDFLDTHPEYELCCHRYKILNQNDGTWNQDYIAAFFTEGTNAEGFAFTKKDNLHTWITKTMTLLYRASVALPDTAHFRYWRDVHWNYYMLKQGRGYCLPWIGAVYRRQDGGVFAPLSNWQKQKVGYLITNELLRANPDDVDLKDYMKELHKTMLDSIRALVQQHRWKEAWERGKLYFPQDRYLYGNRGLLFSLKKLLHSYIYSWDVDSEKFRVCQICEKRNT